MSKYRKKPVVIEAEIWTGNPMDFTALWIGQALFDGTIMADTGNRGLLIRTLEGTMEAQTGDYLIRGVKGEIYPCKPDIFNVTYEPIE